MLFLTHAALAQFYKDPRRDTSVGFSVDLPVPASKLAQAVTQVVDSGTIEGTYIYKGDTDVEDAMPATTSKAFIDNPGPGKVFYKVRLKALSPAHFPASNDMGTITVRYVVTPINEQRSRLKIDAVFIEDAERVRCFSDGSVEIGEYGTILDQVRASMTQVRSMNAAQVNTPDKSVSLQYDLKQERAMLEDAKAAQAKLDKTLEQLKFDTQGQIKTDGIPLKAEPYDHASTLLQLAKGKVVTVLSTTRYWYKIRTEEGVEGWIYYLFLAPVSS
ncbi:MAG TPA: SH3 domain-containing protein [Candidatus Acidoferrum sp.]|nr:SH3 domain-containing protein [Candidatus Acidoferrum sp.]